MNFYVFMRFWSGVFLLSGYEVWGCAAGWVGAKCVRYFDFECEFGAFACGFLKIRANPQLSPNYFAFLVSKLVWMRDRNPKKM